MALAPRLPQFGIALAVLTGGTVLLARRPDDVPRRTLWELLLLYSVPLAIVGWAHVLAGSLERVDSPWEWQALGIYALLGVQLIATLLLLARHRARLGWAALIAAGALWWAAGASYVAVMAVYNDWL